MEKLRSFVKSPVKYIDRNRYALWLLYLPVYLAYFAVLQLRKIPVEAVHIIETPIDRMIPTIPAFFIPYGFWWVLFPGALLYFLFWGSRQDFLKLCFILFSGYTICMVVYTLVPNGLRLREPIESTDIFSRAVLWLRTIDPPRNVCPSMHVSSTVAIDIVVRECRYIKTGYKNAETVVAILICLSTMLIKQHSIIDVALGWGMSVVLWMIWSYRNLFLQMLNH